MAKQRNLTFYEELVLSSTAAVTAKTVAAPLDRVKLVLQSQNEMIRMGTLERPFKGIGDCFRWIGRNEGLAAFWRANFTNCIRYFPSQALTFALKGQVSNTAMFRVNRDDSNAMRMIKTVGCGGLAGAGSLSLTYSLDYARTRLANDLKRGGAREFNGLLDVYRKTWASDGFVGLHRGFVVSLVGFFINRGLFLGLYDSRNPLYRVEASVAAKFCLGYVVTVLAGISLYPFDTVRRRMMMTSGNRSMQYKGSLHVAAYMLKNEGALSFFKGAGANILRGITGALVLTVFDELSILYRKTVT
jgi:solute carrier family 25 (adenine nucleotide translocator) protein 4/5/6/31